MKRRVSVVAICFLCMLACFRLKAQTFEIQQLILDCEKLAQLEEIYDKMIKGYDILSEGYNAVKDISEGNFDLHQLFLDGLLKVNPVVHEYYKVGEIIQAQLRLVSEYEEAFNRFTSDNNFSADELFYMSKVYDNLVDEGVKALSDLTNVLTDGMLRASDDERLAEIDRLNKDMQERLSFLRFFNNNTSVLSLQRSREKNDAGTLKGIYGITNQ